MFGSLSFGVSYALNENIMLGIFPELKFPYDVEPDIYGGGATVSVAAYFKKMYDGFYLEVGGRVFTLSQDGDSVVGGGPVVLAGYSWIWDSGFNINAGLGMGYNFLTNDNFFGASSVNTMAFEGTMPAARMQFGYAF